MSVDMKLAIIVGIIILGSIGIVGLLEDPCATEGLSAGCY